MNRQFASVLVILVACAAAATAQDAPKPAAGPPAELVFQGPTSGATTWSGRVRLTGDVEVPEQSTLVIRSGTTIVIDATDARHGGWNPALIEIQVKGSLRVEGRLDAPVTFGPAETPSPEAPVDPQTPPTWHGLVLHAREGKQEERNTVRGAVFACAFAAVQVADGSPLVEDCVFSRCQIGVETGAAYKNRDDIGMRGEGCPEIARSRFAQCISGVYAEGAARPDVYRCVFYRCGNAVGNRRPGRTYSLRPPGVRVVQCALLKNQIGVAGSVQTRDSIFAGNERAVLMSSFHSRFGVHIDGMSVRACLFDGNAVDIEGDLGMGADLLQGTSGFKGPLDDLLTPWPPLPPCLDLGAGSAASGKGTGGRDLGPAVPEQADPSSVAWQPAGTPVTAWIAAPATGATDATWRASKELTPGERLGRSYWATAGAGDDRTVDLRAAFGLDPSGWLGLRFTAPAAAEVTLEINGDTEVVEFSCNGAAPTRVQQRHRRSDHGATFPVKVKAGNNALVLFVRGFGAAPRLAVSLGGDWQALASEPGAEVAFVSARALLVKGERFLEVTFKPGLHWNNAVRDGVVALRHIELDQTGTAPVNLLGSDKLRIGPLPKTWSKGNLELKLLDVRDVYGRPTGGETKVRVKMS